MRPATANISWRSSASASSAATSAASSERRRSRRAASTRDERIASDRLSPAASSVRRHAPPPRRAEPRSPEPCGECITYRDTQCRRPDPRQGKSTPRRVVCSLGRGRGEEGHHRRCRLVPDRGAVPAVGGPCDPAGRARRLGQHDVSARARQVDPAAEPQDVCPSDRQGAPLAPGTHAAPPAPDSAADRKRTARMRLPAPWSIYRWIDGEPAAIVGVADHDRLADDLAAFLVSLERVSTDGGPQAGPHSFNRGGPVSVWDTADSLDHRPPHRRDRRRRRARGVGCRDRGSVVRS